MFGARITLFKLFGFEVRIDASWILIAILITWSLARGVFPVYNPNFSAATYWILGVIGALGLFASIVVHELSHSLVARRFGLSMKGITLFLFGGVAEMDEEPSTPKAEFFMAIAGPLASIAIGFIFLGLLALGRNRWPQPPLLILSYLGSINLILAVFNLIPAFPLDGGRVFRSILWGWKKNLRWATRIASTVGSGFGLVLIFIGILSVIAGGLIGGIWWVLIGLFLRSASKMSYQSMLIRGALEGEPVKKFMTPDPITVSPDTTVDHLVEDFIYRYHFQIFPVTNDSKPLTCVNVKDVKHLPKNEWSDHKVAELARPCSSNDTIMADDDAIKALALMNRTGNNRLMVVDNGGKLLGMVAMRDLLKFLTLKIDLDGESKNKTEKRD